MQKAVRVPPDALSLQAPLERSLANVLETAEAAVRVHECALGVGVRRTVRVVGPAAAEEDLATGKEAGNRRRVEAHADRTVGGTRGNDECKDSCAQDDECRERDADGGARHMFSFVR
jgi:hypothetical protein